MESNQLLVTKYIVPIVSQPLVPRPRLNLLLDAGLQRKLTLVSAPAGFGKSTLVATWAASQRLVRASALRGIDRTEDFRPAPQIAWVSLETTDNTPAQFWQYVFTAFEQVVPGSATAALEALEVFERTSLESLVTAFINATLTRPSSSVLVLDDYHVISDEAIHRSLAFFLEHLPSQLHVMLLSRTEPPLPLARLRASRQINEIGVEALRCTIPEMTTFLHDVMGVQLESNVISQMMDRTEGWLVGLQLLGLSLQGRRDPSAVLEELRGSRRHVFDYLMDEVLRQQPEDWQRFLLHTSILERMSAPLCNAVLERNDSELMLEHLERANLFVIALDERKQWFRYHHLFREALQVRLEGLEPGLVRGLHLRASEWFAANGDTFEMASHVIQADAWSRTINLSEPERRVQTGYVAAARAQMAAMQGDAERAREFARMALNLLPPESRLERAATVAAESTAALAMGDINLAYRSMVQAAALMDEAGHAMTAVSQTAVVALYLHMQGQLRVAESLLERTLMRVIRPGDPPAPMASMLYVFQSFLLLERNRLDSAIRLAAQAVQLAEQVGFEAATELGLTILSSIHVARGEYAEAQAAIERAVQMPLQHDNPFQQALAVTPIQVRLWLVSGDLERAQEWARLLESNPRLPAPFAQERLDVARARVLVASRQPGQALVILRDSLPAAVDSGRWHHVLEMWLLQAVAHHQAGDDPAALEVLERAVVSGEPEGYVRRFLDEGPVMASLLEKLRERPLEANVASYLERLLAEFQGIAPPTVSFKPAPKVTKALLEPLGAVHLSRRETEVLEFLARGLTNDDIARRLKVSQYTVKSHVSNLLSKLEARNRTHAVARARALGLLENAD